MVKLFVLRTMIEYTQCCGLAPMLVGNGGIVQLEMPAAIIDDVMSGFGGRRGSAAIAALASAQLP
jgi:hypothetical protein